jgi:hypothetical protein
MISLLSFLGLTLLMENGSVSSQIARRNLGGRRTLNHMSRPILEIDSSNVLTARNVSFANTISNVTPKSTVG